ncbi:hypothetical protein DL765_009465 [Monosporascus sp. GIB2]|nr:hypothetical protein DL765_009465 [Monosporascus sp. GIB2]
MDAEWNNHKETMRHLYLTQQKPLKEVMRHMQETHGFHKTSATLRDPVAPLMIFPADTVNSKAQYENHFKKWGFRKNRAGIEYKILSRKIEKRKKAGKESDVFVNGILLPREKVENGIRHHGYITTIEGIGSGKPGGTSFNQTLTLFSTKPRATARMVNYDA